MPDNHSAPALMQVIKFRSQLPIDEVLRIANERLPEFQAIPGLLQKYYFTDPTSDQVGGCYIWDSAESLQAYRASELAHSIPQAYQVIGAPEIEVFKVEFPLRG